MTLQYHINFGLNYAVITKTGVETFEKSVTYKDAYAKIHGDYCAQIGVQPGATTVMFFDLKENKL